MINTYTPQAELKSYSGRMDTLRLRQYGYYRFMQIFICIHFFIILRTVLNYNYCLCVVKNTGAIS